VEPGNEYLGMTYGLTARYSEKARREGWIREGGLFFSGERKNLICRWLSLEVRT